MLYFSLVIKLTLHGILALYYILLLFLTGNIHLSTNEVDLLLAELKKVNGVSEVIINSPDNIFIEKSGNLIQLDTKLSKDDMEITAMLED